ncbi:hypothetical protein ACQ4PT_046113 [Festuca glaucescens]
MADDDAAGVPEPGRGVRRPQHLAAVRVQEHLRRRHHPLRHQRGDPRRPLLRLLDAHPHPLIKYVSIVLRADDNGEGGTFALYSLICRHANVSLLPNRQVADEELSTYRLEHPPEAAAGHRSRLKDWLEMHRSLKTALLVMVMIGTCMIIGDGVLTPAISVFSAVSGLELSCPRVSMSMPSFR